MSPATAQLTALAATVQLSVEVRDQNGNVMAGATVNWSSGDASVAAVGASGLVTAVGNGTAAIAATAGTAAGSATVTVAQEVDAVAVSPAGDTLVTGGTLRLAAEATDANGHPVTGAEFSWASGDTLVAMVDDVGLVTAVDEGNTEVTATASGITGRAQLTVVAPLPPRPAASVFISSQSVAEGGSLTLTFTLDAAPDSKTVVRAALGTDGDPDTPDADADDFGGTDLDWQNVEFLAGVTEVNATIDVDDDLDPEPAWEMFTVTLISPGDSLDYVLGDHPATRVVRIEEGVCDRTPQVRDALLDASSGSSCGSLTPSDLLGITELDLSAGGAADEPALAHSICSDASELLVGDHRLSELCDLRGDRGSRASSAPKGPIRSLRSGDFHGLANLERLFLQRNGLSTLPPEVFAGLHSLTLLSLDGNPITALPSDVFRDLAQLAVLGMQDTRVAMLPPDLFAGLSNLRWLDPGSRSRLDELPPGIFAGLTNLTVLQLVNTGITGLPPRIFADLGRLRSLNLYGNAVASLPTGVFDNLGNLTGLHLGSNRLTTLPDGVFGNLALLRQLDLGQNRLEVLQRDLFAGLDSLRILDLEYNPGSPFRVTIEIVRTDSEDPMAAPPAELAIGPTLRLPFPLRVDLSVTGGGLSRSQLALAPFDTLGSVTATRDSGGGAWNVAVGGTSGVPGDCDDREAVRYVCFTGLDIAAGYLVMRNPEAITLSIPSAHVTQATQDLDGGVTLVSGRQGLLRAFVVADEFNGYRPTVRARFTRHGEEVAVVTLERTGRGGVPRWGGDSDELDRRGAATYNGLVTGDLIRAGTAFRVEVDTAGVPLGPASQVRFPETGPRVFGTDDVIELPAFDLAWVPIHFGSEANRPLNHVVDRVIRDGSEEALRFMTAVLPIGEMNVRVREPYVTWADTTESGPFALLRELEMLRHADRPGGDTIFEYYYGVFAPPNTASNIGSWKDLGGLAGTFAAIGDRIGPFAHELGHTLSLEHAPCGTSSWDPGFPYEDGSIGVWGWNGTGHDLAGRFLPPSTKDIMTYCGGVGISDYNWEKALSHRKQIEQPASAAIRSPVEPTLLVSGGVDGEELRLDPAFEWRSAAKLPSGPGRYRLDGLAEGGSRLFSFSFDPDPLSHGGSSFLFAVPFDPSWDATLDRIVFAGPEGRAMVDRWAGDRAGIVTDADGRIRSIVRELSPDAIAVLQADASDGMRILRGLPRHSVPDDAGYAGGRSSWQVREP